MGIKYFGPEREFSQDIFCLYESMLRGWGWELGGREVCEWISIERFRAFIILRVMMTSFARTSARVTSRYTGCFMMFSVIINISNKENQRTNLNGIVHSHRKSEKLFFLTTIDVRCVHHRWHGTHRYDIQVLATYTHVNMGASIFFTAAMIRGL